MGRKHSGWRGVALAFSFGTYNEAGFLAEMVSARYAMRVTLATAENSGCLTCQQKKPCTYGKRLK